jgi:hypothetical protein
LLKTNLISRHYWLLRDEHSMASEVGQGEAQSGDTYLIQRIKYVSPENR